MTDSLPKERVDPPRYWSLGPFYVRCERRYYRGEGWFVGLNWPLKRNGDPREIKVHD